MITLTKELIESCQTEKGGFTYAQIRSLGLNPKEKWKNKAIGMQITTDQLEEFKKLGSNYIKQKNTFTIKNSAKTWIKDDFIQNPTLKDLESVFTKHSAVIYVLELTNSKYYVGQTTNITRFKDHFNGSGSTWTQLHKPIKILEITTKDTKEASLLELYENIKTVEYFFKYGFINVRGGFWCQSDEEEHEKSIYTHYDDIIRSLQGLNN